MRKNGARALTANNLSQSSIVPVGESGGVHQTIDAAESFDRFRHDGCRRGRICKVGLDEDDGPAWS
jgi:hypothetical protein